MLQPSKGFHLIEILITLIIMGLLAGFTIPIYSQHLVRAKRLEAAQQLSRLAIAMEQYQIEHQSYEKATLSALDFPEFIVKNNYQLVIQSATNDDYVLAAKPLAHQAEQDTSCATLLIDSRGEKSVTGSSRVDECW